MSEITQDKAENALGYLTKTDADCAAAKALLEGLTRQEKTIKATAFLDAQGSVAERNARAEVSALYTEHTKKIEAATLDFETLRNRRNTASMVIEMWRSLNANRRHGNV